MADFTWIPDQEPSREGEPRLLTVKFGDGYESNTPDGLNHIKDRWSLSFTLRTKAEIIALIAFVRGKGGVTPFTWTDPYGVTKSYLCKSWKDSVSHDFNCSASITLEEWVG